MCRRITARSSRFAWQHDADERHPVLLTVLAHGSHDRGVGEEYYYNIAQMQTFVEIGLAEAEREDK